MSSLRPNQTCEGWCVPRSCSLDVLYLIFIKINNSWFKGEITLHKMIHKKAKLDQKSYRSSSLFDVPGHQTCSEEWP